MKYIGKYLDAERLLIRECICREKKKKKIEK